MSSESETLWGGVILGVLLTSLAAFFESDSANIHEYKYGEFICEKNGGLQYFEKRGIKWYWFVCKDKAQFSADSEIIYNKVGAWADNVVLEESK